MWVECHSEGAGNITADNRRITSILSDMILVVGTDKQSCSGLHSLRGLSGCSLGLQWEVNLRRGLESALLAITCLSLDRGRGSLFLSAGFQIPFIKGKCRNQPWNTDRAEAKGEQDGDLML